MNLTLLSKPTSKMILRLIPLLSFFVLNFFYSVNSYSQLAERQVWDGPFDIKMIGAPNLHPVFVNTTGASSGNLLADSILSYNVIQRTYDLININNDYKGGSPFKTVSLPMSAFLCKGDPNVGGCVAGLPTVTPTATCPEKYNNPTMVSRMVSMSYADYDNDLTTYSSSMAELAISSCSEIEAAYLYWAGMFQGSNDNLTLLDGPSNSFNGVNASNVFNVTTSSGYNQVKFKIPGGAYQNITADEIISPSGLNKYVCMKDVTNILQGTGGGQFWVGNIQSYPIEGGGGSSSGWSLVVIFRSPLSPPRRISLWDGLGDIASTTPSTFTLTGLQTPSTTNFKSYVGFAALDAEDMHTELDGDAPNGMGFQTNNGPLFTINPLLEQPPYKLYAKDGYPMACDEEDNIDDLGCKKPLYDGNWCSVYDGITSSHITTYDETTDKNGNEIVRLPDHKNTLGLDIHHMKLPNGAITAGATSATISLSVGGSGSYNLYLAYIAIERLQPKLAMSKYANSPTTAPGSTITYTLRVRNQGNTPSLGATIYDTLDVATTYAGSLSSIRYVNGAASGSAGVTLVASSSGRLQFRLTNPIAVKDSVDITFTVNVEPLSNSNLWNVQCKRSILNTGWIRYKISSTAGNTDSLTAKSNSNDCGIGSETRVLVTGFTNAVTTLGPFDACSFLDESSLTHVRNRLAAAGEPASIIDEFDVRDPNNIRVNTTDVFSSVPNNTMIYKAYRDVVSGGNCQKIYEIRFSSCVLPVELISFDGWKENNTNVLAWSTAWEVNNDHFIIERSVDGVHFTAIGTLQGKGNSSTINSYRFEDEQPYNGANYYRLKQVDHDGSFSHSNIIALTNEKADINIYPNPNEGTFTISLLAPEKTYTLEIMDVDGRLVYANAGEIVPSSVEISNLAKGVYIVRFHIDQETVIKKMVVY